MTFKSGQYLVICDRCHHKVYSSKTIMEWNGWRVCLDCYDPKHPQLEEPIIILDNPPLQDISLEPSDRFSCPFEIWNTGANFNWNNIECIWGDFRNPEEDL